MQEAKIYKYGEHEYEMLPASLDMLNRAAPVLIKYKKLEFQHTSDIDMTAVYKVQERLEELELAITDLESEPEAKRDKKRLKELKSKLKKERAEFESDTGLQAGIALYNELRGMAMYQLVTDVSLMQPFLYGILKGDLSKLDFSNMNIVSFIQQVVSDFFLIMKKSKEE